MYRNMKRAQREASFLELDTRMYSALEDWYEEHPEARFGEIEKVARRQRREMMGETLAVLVSGRDTGFQLHVMFRTRHRRYPSPKSRFRFSGSVKG